MTGPRWLWISGQISASPSTGLLVYSSSLVSALAEAGVEITMVGIGTAAAVPETVDVRPVAGTLRGGLTSLASTLPNLSFACATPEMRKTVEQLLADGLWDAVIIDHLQTAWVAPLLPADVKTAVFVTHNHEASVRHRVARQRPLLTPRGLLLRVDAWKAGRLERAALQRADVVTSITESDQRLFMADATDARHVVVRPGLSGGLPSTVRPLSERPRRVGIVGSFEWHVKQDNLLHVVTAAGPHLAAAGIELAIGGKMPDHFAKRLMATSDSVDCVGWVDSVTEFLGGCRIGVIAEPLGGGFKLKSLDYIANRIPVAATTGSLDGLPLVGGQSMIEASDEEELGRVLVSMIDDTDQLERIANSALSACSTTLRWGRTGRFTHEGDRRRVIQPGGRSHSEHCKRAQIAALAAFRSPRRGEGCLMNRRLVVIVSMVILATSVAGFATASSGAAGGSPDPATYGMRTNGAYLSESRLRQSEAEVGSSINWFVAMAGRQSPADMRGSVFGQLKQRNAVLPTVSDRMNLVMTVPLAFGRETAKTDQGRRTIRNKLLETARGNWDNDFRTVAETLVNGGYPDAVIRLGHEFTGSWYPWSAQGNEDAYIAAYRRVHDVMQEVSPDFRFEWNAARNTFVKYGPPAYPGDAYVDIIGIDVYYEPWKGDKSSFDDGLWERRYESILTAHQEFAADHGKPVSYAEWANGGVDEPEFIRAMHGWFASLPKSGPGSLLYQAYFNATKALYDLDRYPQSKRTFIELFGGAGQVDVPSPATIDNSPDSDPEPDPLVVDLPSDPDEAPAPDAPRPTQPPSPTPAAPEPATNGIPTVTAPSSISAVQGQPVTIDIQSTGTKHQWWKKSGPGVVNWADRTATDPEATFRKAGTYQLAVKAKNGNKSSVTYLTVQVSASSGDAPAPSPAPAPAPAPTPTGGLAKLSIPNAAVDEGSVLVFKLVLDKATNRDVVISVATAGGTAKSGTDFVRRTTEVTIPAGETRVWVGVRTKVDSLSEPAEDLRLRIVEISGASAERTSAKGTINAN